MSFFIVPSPSVCPKDSKAKVNMLGACVACGLPLSAYDILCVCILPCGHQYHTFCFVGWIGMKAEICASHGCKELVAKVGRALLSPKGNVHKVKLMSTSQYAIFVSLNLWGILMWLTGVTMSTTISGNSCADDVMSYGANLDSNIGAHAMNDVDLCSPMSTTCKEEAKEEAMNGTADAKFDSGELPLDTVDQSPPIFIAQKEGIQEKTDNLVDTTEIPKLQTFAGSDPNHDMDDIQFTPVSTPQKKVQDAARMESVEEHAVENIVTEKDDDPESPHVTIADAVRKAKKRRKKETGM